jgi:protein gp37
MDDAPQHTFQVLTKRPERMHRFMRDYYTVDRFTANGTGLPIANVWLGTTVENNDYAWRADMLRETPAAVRFLSIEPMLGPVDKVSFEGIDWVIVGGESGHDARPMHPKWVADVRDRCVAARIPFFFKQWGEWKPICEIDEDADPNLLYHPAPAHDPERARKARYENIVHHFDGSEHDPIALGSWLQGCGAMLTFRLGKKNAGRELGSRTWDEFPAVRA